MYDTEYIKVYVIKRNSNNDVPAEDTKDPMTPANELEVIPCIIRTMSISSARVNKNPVFILNSGNNIKKLYNNLYFINRMGFMDIIVSNR